MSEEMQFITFKQFIYTINIRQYVNEVMSNSVLRLLYTENNESCVENDYIEIGWYDYFNKNGVWQTLSKILNEKILNSIVTDFRYDDKLGVLVVYLSDVESMKETLEEYQN